MFFSPQAALSAELQECADMASFLKAQVLHLAPKTTFFRQVMHPKLG